jgi:hypothetical protein
MGKQQPPPGRPATAASGSQEGQPGGHVDDGAPLSRQRSGVARTSSAAQATDVAAQMS